MMPDRVLRRDLGGRGRVRDDLAVDARFAHAARDQLRVLGAEVDDEDGALRMPSRSVGQRLFSVGIAWVRDECSARGVQLFGLAVVEVGPHLARDARLHEERQERDDAAERER